MASGEDVVVVPCFDEWASRLEEVGPIRALVLRASSLDSSLTTKGINTSVFIYLSK
jgi:hypothetical protein